MRTIDRTRSLAIPRITLATIAGVAVVALCPVAALAQSGEQDPYWAPRIGFGFTASPESFALGFDAPFTFFEGLSVGPTFRLGLAEDRMVKPSVAVGYAFRSDDGSGDFYSGLSPHVAFGVGLIYLDKDSGPDGTGFLMHWNTGVEYWIDQNIAIGSLMIFDVMPAQVANDNFVYEWQILTMRVRF